MLDNATGVVVYSLDQTIALVITWLLVGCASGFILRLFTDKFDHGYSFRTYQLIILVVGLDYVFVIGRYLEYFVMLRTIPSGHFVPMILKATFIVGAISVYRLTALPYGRRKADGPPNDNSVPTRRSRATPPH